MSGVRFITQPDTKKHKLLFIEQFVIIRTYENPEVLIILIWPLWPTIEITL